MKTHARVGFLLASIALIVSLGVKYGTAFASATSVEIQRYSSVNPKYIYIVIGVILASYLFGYVFSRANAVTKS